MATVKQIQFRLRLAKKTLARLNKDVTATRSRVKKLEAELKKAKAAEKAKKAKKAKPAARKKPAAKKKTAAKRSPAKKKTAKKK